MERILTVFVLIFSMSAISEELCYGERKFQYQSALKNSLRVDPQCLLSATQISETIKNNNSLLVDLRSLTHRKSILINSAVAMSSTDLKSINNLDASNIISVSDQSSLNDAIDLCHQLGLKQSMYGLRGIVAAGIKVTPQEVGINLASIEYYQKYNYLHLDDFILILPEGKALTSKSPVVIERLNSFTLDELHDHIQENASYRGKLIVVPEELYPESALSSVLLKLYPEIYLLKTDLDEFVRQFSMKSMDQDKKLLSRGCQ